MSQLSDKSHTPKVPCNRPFEVIMGPVTLQGSLWKGVSACLMEDGNTGNICVITAPDKEQLEFFWNQLTKDKLNHNLTKTTLGNYECAETQAAAYHKPVGEVPRTSRRRAPVEEEPQVDLPWDEAMYYIAFGAEGEEVYEKSTDLSFLLSEVPPLHNLSVFIFEVKNPKEDGTAIYRWHRGKSIWIQL